MKNKYTALSLISLFVVVFDLGIKLYVHSEFRLGESISIIPNYFNLTYIRNPGAAFGFLADSHPEFRRIFFTLMPPIACILIFQIFRGVRSDDRMQIYSLSLIMGGAIGNYLNRMYHSYVIDFLDFHIYGKYNWPAFNLADIAIVCGVGMLLFLTLKEKTFEAHKVQFIASQELIDLAYPTLIQRSNLSLKELEKPFQS